MIIITSLGVVVCVAETSSGRFTNLDGSDAPAAVVPAFRMLVVDNITGRNPHTPRTASVPAVTPDLARISKPPGPGEGARLTWIGHASWLVQLDGKSFLIDPSSGN